MNQAKEWKISIQQAAGTFNKDIVEIMACTVDSVSKSSRTCECSTISGNSTSKLSNVQLMAQVADGLLLLPTVGSTVMVGKSTRNVAFVLMYSDVDNIVMLGGDLGGLVKVVDVVAKINALENLVNNILNTLKTTTIPLAPSGTYPFAPLYTSFNNIAPITARADIENTNITQG